MSRVGGRKAPAPQSGTVTCNWTVLDVEVPSVDVGVVVIVSDGEIVDLPDCVEPHAAAMTASTNAADDRRMSRVTSRRFWPSTAGAP